MRDTSRRTLQTGVRLIDSLSRLQDGGLPLEDQVVLAQVKECLRELIEAPWMSDMVLEQIRRGTNPLEYPGAPTERTRDVLRSLSDNGKREYLRQLFDKTQKMSERAVVEAAFAQEFGSFFEP